MIYEIVFGETASLTHDRWLIKANSLLQAVQEADKKRKASPELFEGWKISSAKEIGQLEEE